MLRPYRWFLTTWALMTLVLTPVFFVLRLFPRLWPLPILFGAILAILILSLVGEIRTRRYIGKQKRKIAADPDFAHTSQMAVVSHERLKLDLEYDTLEQKRQELETRYHTLQAKCPHYNRYRTHSGYRCPDCGWFEETED